MAYPILAPSNTWYKSSVTRNTITEINIVDSYTPTSYDETWNADVDNTGSIKCYRTGTVLTIAGDGSGKIAMNEDSNCLFSYALSSADTTKVFVSLTAINGINLLDSSNVTNMRSLFAHAKALTSLDLSSWDTSRVTNMRYMFGIHSSIGNMALTTLNLGSWNTSNVTDTTAMFQGCVNLSSLDVANWDVSKVTAMNSMFYQSAYGEKSALTSLDVSKWNTSSCTDMSSMFYGCSKLTSLDVSNWDVSKVTSFDHTFGWCIHLVPQGLENWDTSSAIDMNAMFHSNANTSLDLSGWDVSHVKYFQQMFERNTKLTEIKGLENWDTSSGLTFEQMFYGCQNLKCLNLSSFDTRNAVRMQNMFGATEGETNQYGWMMRLEKVILGENFSFNGDGTATPAVLPTPDVTYISGADGNWYNADGNACVASEIPSGAGTYWAAFDLIDIEYLIRKPTMLRMANAVRNRNGTTDAVTTDDIIDSLNSSGGGGVVVDPNTIIEKTATGEDIISLNDVSEIAHKVGVTVTGNAGEEITLTVTGDNLFGGEALANQMVAIGATKDETNRTVTFNPANISTAQNPTRLIFDKFKENTQYTIIMYGRNSTSSYNKANLRVTYTSGTQGLEFAEAGTDSYLVYTTTAGKSVLEFNVEWYGGTTTLLYDYCGIFEGVITEAQFQGYVGVDYTVLSGDTVLVDSFYPNMNFIADASLSVEYHRSYGMEREYDRFWDAYQQNGNRIFYQGGFAGAGWNKDTFKPKYPVTITTTSGADNMFMYCNRGNTTDGTDDLLDFTEFNSLFDFSGGGRLQQTFYNARIKNLYVDGSSATTMSNTFNADNGGYIENLTLKVTATTTNFGGAFSYQYHMKNITFTDDSVIAANISFNYCSKLTKASITSIINALSSSTSGKTLTLSKTAKEAAFTADEWSALIATKPNWTISLA